jgi:hypothetical protein
MVAKVVTRIKIKKISSWEIEKKIVRISYKK